MGSQEGDQSAVSETCEANAKANECCSSASHSLQPHGVIAATHVHLERAPARLEIEPGADGGVEVRVGAGEDTHARRDLKEEL